MFILSVFNRGYASRFWPFLFLVTFSGFIVHVAANGGDTTYTAQLVSQIRSGIMDVETGFIGKNGLVDANGCVHWHYIKVEKNLALWNSGGGDITSRLENLEEMVRTLILMLRSTNSTVAAHYFQTTMHSDVLQDLSKMVRSHEDKMAKKFNDVTDQYMKALQRFDALDQKLKSVGETANETNAGVATLIAITVRIEGVIRSWVNPERWIAGGRMLWSVGYLGYYTRGRYPTLKLILIFLVCMAFDIYHIYSNTNAVAEFFIRTQDYQFLEWAKTAISVGLTVAIKEWGYDSQLKEMRVDSIDRNTTNTDITVNKVEQKMEIMQQQFDKFLKLYGNSPAPAAVVHVLSQPPSAPPPYPAADGDVLFSATDSGSDDEGSARYRARRSRVDPSA